MWDGKVNRTLAKESICFCLPQFLQFTRLLFTSIYVCLFQYLFLVFRFTIFVFHNFLLSSPDIDQTNQRQIFQFSRLLPEKKKSLKGRIATPLCSHKSFPRKRNDKKKMKTSSIYYKNFSKRMNYRFHCQKLLPIVANKQLITIELIVTSKYLYKLIY